MQRHGWSAALALTALLLGGCGQESETPDQKGRPPATPLVLPGEPDTAAPSEPIADSALPGPATDSTAAAGPTGAAAEWTSGIVARLRPGTEPAVLRSVRAARNDGFDRVVFEFERDVPGYHIEYVDRPVRQCGSGDPVDLPLSARGQPLTVRFDPAYAHTEEGRPTVTDRQREPRLDVLKELKLICDFEAQVEWVLGMDPPNRYRVLELASPARLIIDVRH